MPPSKFNIPRLPNAPPNTPSVLSTPSLLMPKVRTRTITNIYSKSDGVRMNHENSNQKKLKILSVSDIQNKLTKLQNELSAASIPKKSSVNEKKRLSLDSNNMKNEQEKENVSSENYPLESKYKMETNVPVHERFMRIASKCDDLNDAEQMQRVIQSIIEYRHKKQQQRKSNMTPGRRPRRGIGAPVRRVLVREDYVRDGSDEMDASFVTHFNDESSLLEQNNPNQSMMMEYSFMQDYDSNRSNDDNVRTLGLLLQRVHEQQELSIAQHDESDATQTSEWSFNSAKESLLADPRAKQLAVTWIALAELRKAFDETATKDDIIIVYDEGEGNLLGNQMQINVIRHARDKYLTKKVLGLRKFKTPQKLYLINSGKESRSQTYIGVSQPPISNSVKNQDTAVGKDMNNVVYTSPSDKICLNDPIAKKVVFKELKSPKITACSEEQLSDKFDSLVVTPVRRSKRIAARSSEKKLRC